MKKQSDRIISAITSRVLIVCSKVPAPEGATGDRCWSLAESLAPAHDVILALPEVTQLFHEDFAVVYYNTRNIGLVARDSDVAVCDAEALESNPQLVDAGIPVVVDVSDINPTSAEVGTADVIAAADFYICLSEEERDRWLGYLQEAGRVNPHTQDGDSELRNLIDVVPTDVMQTEGCLQPLLDYCAVPRFARDRGTHFNTARLPAAPEKPGGLAHYWRRFRYLRRTGGARTVWSRSGAVIRRRFSK